MKKKNERCPNRLNSLVGCPFCGRNDRLSAETDGMFWWVECTNCGTLGPNEDNRTDAVKLWCKRKAPNDNVQPDAAEQGYAGTAGSQVMEVRMNQIKQLFEENIIREIGSDFYTIRCRKGLWSVSGSCAGAVAVENEARHYFVQYLQDGEYDTANRVLGGKLSTYDQPKE